MIRVRLSDQQCQQLEAAVRSAPDRRHRDRLRAVLLAHEGRPRQGIAAELGVDRRSVTRWINAFREGGLAGLMPRKAPGKTPGIPASVADEIKRWVIEGPARHGLGLRRWTHRALAGRLVKAHGIRTSRSAVQRFCARSGVRLRRPA